MEIKRDDPEGSHRRLWRLIHRTGLKRAMLVVLCTVALLTLVFTSMRFGVRMHAAGQANSYHELVQHTLHAAAQPLRTAHHVLRGLQAKPERLVLDLPFENWQQLVAKHTEAVEAGTLYETENPVVGGKMRHGTDTVKVDVRLKGSLEHLNNNKWSLRVDVDEADQAIMGMTTFSLQHPGTRAFLNEWVFHQLLTREGLIALQYDFVDVTINGRHMGIYALEQHFAKEVIATAQRPEGVILVLDEELYNVNRWQTPWHNKVRELRPYEENQVLANEGLTKQVLAARSLVEMFRRQELHTCEVFDCPQLARYFALLDLLGAQHAAGSGNMKMYFNPITARLEPIGFDAEPDEKGWPSFLTGWSNYSAMPDSVQWLRDIFSDEEFMSQYLTELYRVSEPAFLDEFFRELAPALNTKADILYASYPTYEFDRQFFYDRQKSVREVLQASKALDAYVQQVEPTAIGLEVGTLLPFPVEITGLQYQGTTIPIEPRVLPALRTDRLVRHERITVPLPTTIDPTAFTTADVRLTYRLLGQQEERSEGVSPFARLVDEYLAQDVVRQTPNAHEFPFVRFDQQRNSIHLSPGNWDIDHDLIIPAGYTVIAGPNTTLNLQKGAQIISYSPLQFIGTPEQPIEIESSDDQGTGVAILSAGGRSKLEYVIASNLSAPRGQYWNLTGTITFYESPVDIKSSIFRKNREAAEAVHLVRSPFSLTDTLFENSFGDSLDIDFSSGRIDRTHIYEAGNNGIDITGSTVAVTDAVIEKSSRTGLQATERSEVVVSNAAVSQGHVGITSKDLSEVTVQGGELTDIEIGVAAYQSKPTFGPGRLTVQNVTLNRVEEPYLAEEGSLVIRDAEVQPARGRNLAARLEGL